VWQRRFHASDSDGWTELVVLADGFM